MSCECGSKISFENCCGRFLVGKQQPDTAEELMRARFVAFGMGEFDFLARTQTEPLSEAVRSGEAPEWESLKILSTTGGGLQDSHGTVEFVAHYHQNGCRNHHERSYFLRNEEGWRFLRGDLIEQGTHRRTSSKVGRNDPCPCQSGRKYKRCCGV